MRVIFMGSPEFSIPTLNHLLKANHEIVAVYCQPPRSKNRGHHLHRVPVHEHAEKLGLSVFTPKTLRTSEAQEIFRSHKADIAVVVAYGLILPQAILETPIYGCINVHASLLPRWRGAAPIHRALLGGDKETGITIMQMDTGLDTGNILLMESVPISCNMTLSKLFQNLSLLGAELLINTLDQITDNNLTSLSQPLEGITYAHKITKEEGLLDWNEKAEDLERKIRALNPWPGTWFPYHNDTIKVLKASVLKHNNKEKGTFYSTVDHPLIIQCGDNSLFLEILQRPGKKALLASEFLKGNHVFDLQVN